MVRRVEKGVINVLNSLGKRKIRYKAQVTEHIGYFCSFIFLKGYHIF